MNSTPPPTLYFKVVFQLVNVLKRSSHNRKRGIRYSESYAYFSYPPGLISSAYKDGCLHAKRCLSSLVSFLVHTLFGDTN